MQTKKSRAGIIARGPAIIPAMNRSTLARMNLDSKTTAFFPVSELKLADDGTPTTIFCLLRARLDNATEKRWKDAGLLEADVSSESFVRSVTLKNRNDVDNLYDWHVESVALTLDQNGHEHDIAAAGLKN